MVQSLQIGTVTETLRGLRYLCIEVYKIFFSPYEARDELHAGTRSNYWGVGGVRENSSLKYLNGQVGGRKKLVQPREIRFYLDIQRVSTVHSVA